MVCVLEHCPKLRELTLTFDTDVVDINPLERPGGAICNRNITVLGIGFSVVKDPAAAAAFLSEILPNLRFWGNHGPGHPLPEYQKQWEQVLGLIKDLKRVRE